MKRNFLLLFSFVIVFIFPMIGGYLKWGGWPPGYGDFPARQVQPEVAFNSTIFGVCCCIAFIFLLFLFFPRIFGFKKAPSESPIVIKKTVAYPSYFYPALIITLSSWFFMWTPLQIFETISHYTFVPLWWGFIFVLDGIVYKRNNGVSLMSSRPTTVKILAVASCFSWFVFEFQNFFVLENWYYPNDKIFTNFGNISWQLISYTTVLPAIFEFYWLLKTFKIMREKYAFGPIVNVSTKWMYFLLVIGLLSLIVMAYYPQYLFWMLWVSLVPALVPAMTISKFWTPFTSVSKSGDYTSVVLIAIATVMNGFFWEFWNFGSEYFKHNFPTNPNYWQYSVPYIDKYHFFSEMPILGYFGYLLFGITCWVLWLALAYLIGFDAAIEQPIEEQES